MHDWIEGAAMSVESCGHGNTHPGRWQFGTFPSPRLTNSGVSSRVPSCLQPKPPERVKSQLPAPRLASVASGLVPASPRRLCLVV